MLALAAIVVLGSARGLSYEPASAADAPQALVACRSQLASLEAALYVADQQACLNVGVQRAVPPPSKKAARR
jgi:hypothetical protein